MQVKHWSQTICIVLLQYCTRYCNTESDVEGVMKLLHECYLPLIVSHCSGAYFPLMSQLGIQLSPLSRAAILAFIHFFMRPVMIGT